MDIHFILLPQSTLFCHHSSNKLLGHLLSLSVRTQLEATVMVPPDLFHLSFCSSFLLFPVINSVYMPQPISFVPLRVVQTRSCIYLFQNFCVCITIVLFNAPKFTKIAVFLSVIVLGFSMLNFIKIGQEKLK
jgi:hypothetical protein